MLPISVIVPYHRGKKFLPALKRSLQNQLAAEVIVIVDGGEEIDDVRDALADVDNLRVIATSPAVGTAAARNRAASLATQEWITFLDQDDWWPDAFLRKLFEQAKSDVLAYDNHLFNETHAEPIAMGRTVFEDVDWSSSEVSAKSAHLLMNKFPMVKLLLPRRAFEEVGGYRGDIYAVEDFDLVWRLVARGNALSFVREPVGSYLIRADSTTGRISRGDHGPSLMATRSWLRIWTAIVFERQFPFAARRLAAVNGARSIVRLSKLALRVRRSQN